MSDRYPGLDRMCRCRARLASRAHHCGSATAPRPSRTPAGGTVRPRCRSCSTWARRARSAAPTSDHIRSTAAVLRERLVLLLPLLQVGDRHLEVDVLVDARANVDDHRRQDEVARIELVGAPRRHVEVTWCAVVRPCVLALLDVLQV